MSFLHARFGLGEDVLKPYKETLERWPWPDVVRNQDTSVAKAKQAISSYKKAVGDAVGLTELMVFLPLLSKLDLCHTGGVAERGVAAAAVA